jgi:hypothetical protein
MRDLIEILGCVLLAIVGVFGGLFGTFFLFFWASTSYECSSYAELTGKEAKSILTTCYINDEQFGWQSYSEQEAGRLAERGLTNFGQGDER